MANASTNAVSLSNPTLLSSASLATNSALTSQLFDLINVAFLRPKARNPEKWVNTQRLKSLDELFTMLGDEGMMCVIYEIDEEGPSIGIGKGKVVACAAAVPWAGGWLGEGKGTEKGWEIKTVCVDGDARYAKTGLAIRIVDCLEQYLVKKEKEKVYGGDVQTNGEGSTKGFLHLWILTAECLQGAYWRKRGYTFVRSSVATAPTWGCRTSFDMTVLKRDVAFEI